MLWSAVSVTVVPLAPGARPQTYSLEAVPGGKDYQAVLALTMPAGADALPLLVRFQQGGKELRTLELNLDVEAP